MFRKKPKVVVITGASAGVGRAAVREFARRGAAIGLIARNVEALEAAQHEVNMLGGRALILPVDVADSAAMEAAATRVESELGPIDVWVNNAMVTVVSPVSRVEPEEVQRVTEVTYLGTVYGTLAALRHMRPRNRGVIVQVGSALAYRAIPLQAPYCAAKFAIRGFTDSLRCELMNEGSRIHVTMVHLPALDTPQFDWCRTRMDRKPQPVPPIFAPEVAARAIVWAAAHRRRELFVGGPTYQAIWGNKVAPHLLDRYLARAGAESQLSLEPVESNRQDNLWAPVPGDHGAHGRFGSQSHRASRALWLTMHRASLAAAGMAFGLLAFALRHRNYTRTAESTATPLSRRIATKELTGSAYR